MVRKFDNGHIFVHIFSNYQTILFTVILKSSLVEVYLFLKVFIQSELTIVAVLHFLYCLSIFWMQDEWGVRTEDWGPVKILIMLQISWLVNIFLVSLNEVTSLPASVFLIGSMKAGHYFCINYITFAVNQCFSEGNNFEKLTGTTSLSRALAAHPNFCNDHWKEKNFFQQNQKAYSSAESVSLYTKRFSVCNSSDLTLDATPTYIHEQVVPHRMKAYYGPDEFAKKKFILILRDPVARLVMIGWLFIYTCILFLV